MHNVAVHMGRTKCHGPVGSTLPYFGDPGSDIELETGYIDRGFSWFSSVSP